MRTRTPHALPPAVAVVAADRRVRESLVSLLTASGAARLVGTAGDAAAAVHLVSAGEADVVIVDRDLANGGSGGTLLPRLRRTAPDVRILVIDWDADPAAGLPPGADRVLDLSDQPAALLEALVTAAGD
jgi:DNA-binding NarL/FixJ family response regulator